MSVLVTDLLTKHNTMSLATSCDNTPYAASLFYASYGFTVYFFSSVKSRHAINIVLNPSVAATVNKDHSEWRNIKGLQIKGRAYRVPPEELEVAREVYIEKYPFAVELLHNMNTARSVAVFKLVPETISLIDNEIYFGYSAELRV